MRFSTLLARSTFYTILAIFVAGCASQHPAATRGMRPLLERGARPELSTSQGKPPPPQAGELPSQSLDFAVLTDRAEAAAPPDPAPHVSPTPTAAQTASPPQTTRNGFVRDWLTLGAITVGNTRGAPLRARVIDYAWMKRAGAVDPLWHDQIPRAWRLAPRVGESVSPVQFARRTDAGEPDAWEPLTPNAPLLWRALHAKRDRLMLAAKRPWSVHYFITSVWLPKAVPNGMISVGTGGSLVAITVNGKCVYANKRAARSLISAGEVSGVAWRQGWNLLQVKLMTLQTPEPFFFCRLADAKGVALKRLPISLAPPENALTFVTEKEAKNAKEKIHAAATGGLGTATKTEKPFSPANAVGAKYPLAITFAHDAKNIAGIYPDQPLAYAVAGRDKPIAVTFTVRKTAATLPNGKALPQKFRIIAELVRRDERNAPGPEGLRQDKIINHQESTAALSPAAFTSRTISIPTGGIGYYALVVSVFDKTDRVRLVEHPFAIIADEKYTPETFAAKLSATAEKWQEGDYQRWGAVVVGQKISRQRIAWPVLPLATGELKPPRPLPIHLAAPEGTFSLGTVTPTPGFAPSDLTIIRRDWLEDTRRYTFIADGKKHTLDWAKSAATQAVRAATTYHRLTLFHGLGQAGLRPPRWVAYPTAAGIVTQPLTDGEALAPTLARPWLLFWFGAGDGWTRVDVPVLVVLQKKPSFIERNQAGLTLAFPNAAGTVIAMPLLGTRRVTPRETTTWQQKKTLPKNILADCEFWARAMPYYPVRGRDQFRLRGDDLDIRVVYEYLASKNEWGTPGIRFAPLPYWAALAVTHPTPTVQLPKTIHKTRQLHPLGNVFGDTENGSVTFTLKGVARYVNEMREAQTVLPKVKTKVPPPAAASLTRVRNDLREVSRGEQWRVLSRLAGLGGRVSVGHDFTQHRELLRVDGRTRFGRPSAFAEYARIANLSAALPHLPTAERQPLKALLMRYVDTTTSLYRFRDAGGKAIPVTAPPNDIARWLIGLWRYGHFTGHWQLARDRWPYIKAAFAASHDTLAWEAIGMRDLAAERLLTQGDIAYARTARATKDIPAYLYGVYCAARRLTLTQAFWQASQPNGLHTKSWLLTTPTAQRIAVDDAGDTDTEKNPAILFFGGMMQPPFFRLEDSDHTQEAVLLAPFVDSYLPTTMRFQAERNAAMLQYYRLAWRKRLAAGKRVPLELLTVRGWLSSDAKAVSALLNDYRRSPWGQAEQIRTIYAFENRARTVLPQALTAIIEANGKSHWVKHY